MQQHAGAGHGAETAHAHEHHWEVSWAPMAIAFGVMFLVPLAVTSYFSYSNKLLAIIFMGIGTPMVLAGIAKWVHEGVTTHGVLPNISPVGIGVFIVGEILIFLGLFAAYWTMRISVSAAGGEWPPAGTPELNLVLPLIMTVILVASSLTYHYAEVKLEHGESGAFKLWLVISIVLGSCFLGCTIFEYTHLFHVGFVPSTNQYASAFYSLTGFHGSHVLVGLVSFLVILIGMTVGRVHPMLVKVAGIYWHFVDVIWFFVASQVYFW
jgi:cytochrome c oxidase subunit 3